MHEKVLCVDDDPMLLSGLQRSLGQRFAIETALDGRQAMSLIESSGPYAVLIADLYMPGMNGLELLGQAQRVTPETVRFMLTGDNDRQTAINAVNQGAIFRFLAKPCSHETLSLAIDAGFKQYRLVRSERELLEKTFNGSVTVLISQKCFRWSNRKSLGSVRNCGTTHDSWRLSWTSWTKIGHSKPRRCSVKSVT